MTRKRFTRDQRMVIVSAILCIVVVIAVLQLWLLTATMDAFFRDDDKVLLPAALASLACLGLNLGLLYHIRRIHG